MNLKQGEVILHVDYSESYKNRQQDEIQSAYFGQSSFSLFTACVYYNNNGSLMKKPITVVSESSDHSRIAALHVSMLSSKKLRSLSTWKKSLSGVMVVRRNSVRNMFSNLSPLTVRNYTSTGTTMRPTMGRDPWMG